jgi:hypothetical protein
MYLRMIYFMSLMWMSYMSCWMNVLNSLLISMVNSFVLFNIRMSLYMLSFMMNWLHRMSLMLLMYRLFLIFNNILLMNSFINSNYFWDSRTNLS